MTLLLTNVIPSANVKSRNLPLSGLAGAMQQSLDKVINTLIDIKDLLTIYTTKDAPKLRAYSDELDKVKENYQNDEGIPAEAKEALRNNANYIQQQLNSLASCDSVSKSPNGRQSAVTCPAPEAIISLINQGLPEPVVKKQTKLLEFGRFQWEGRSKDISNKIHTQANRVFIDSLVAATGLVGYWNEYQGHTEGFTRYIYENGLILDASLGVRDVLSADSEDRIINNFYKGSQKEVVFGLGDPVSNKLVEYYKDAFKHPYISKFVERIKPSILENTFNNLTGRFVFDPQQGGINVPDFSFVTEIPFYDFYGIMGGGFVARLLPISFL